MSVTESGTVDESLQAVLERLSDATGKTRPVAKPTTRSEDASTVLAPSSRLAFANGPRPWLSASASLFVWGGGQWLNRQRQLGLLFLSLQVLAISVGWCLSHTWPSWTWLAHLFFIEEVELKTGIAAAGLLVPMAGVVCVLQAYLRAERRPGARPPLALPVVPALASAVVPGWGQILHGQLGKAVSFLCAWWFGLYLVAASRLDPAMWMRIDPSDPPIAGLQLSLGALIALVVAGLAWVLSVYDGALTSRRRRRT